MEPRTLGLLGLIGAVVGYRLLDRRLDERPSGLLTVAVAVFGVLAFRALGSGGLNAEVVLALALLGLLGAAQVVGSSVSVPTRAFGALALAVAMGMAALTLTVFDGHGRGVVGAALIGLIGVFCLLRPEAVERLNEADE